MHLRIPALCFCLACACSINASAAITAFFQQNTISPQAIASDPALANMQSWSVMVTTDGNWASAGLEMFLPAGNTFYNPLLGSNTKSSPALVAIFPNLAYDTYVTSPADTGTSGAPVILGFFPEVPGTGDFGGTTGRFSVSWGDLVVDPPGTYEIVRFTFPLGVLPNINPTSNTSQVSPDSTTFIDVPEPTMLALVVVAGAIMLRR